MRVITTIWSSEATAMWAGLPDVVRELAHDGQRGFHQRAHRRLRHREREQLVGEYIARAVFGGGDEALELEHLQHAEQLARRTAQPLRDRREIERGFFRRKQLDDVEPFLQGGGAIAACSRGVFLGGEGPDFRGHGFFSSSGMPGGGFCPKTP